MSLTNITYGQHAWVSVPKIHTDLLWGLVFLFVGLVCFYFVAIFFYRNKLSAKAKKTQQRKSELAPMISEFLFYDEDGQKEDKSNYIALKVEIRQLLKNDFNRKVLSEILFDLHKDVSGDTQKRLFKLYQDLGLEKDAYRKLRSWRWEVVSKGILELTQMQVAESYIFITKFINDKRKTIRKQAEIATVTLKPEGLAYFLDTTKYRISEWQQLKLLDAVRKLDDFDPPAFKLWLTSKNRHVVLFALRLIKYYNQNGCNASLVALVRHKNSHIREEAINCIKEFHVVEALEALKAMYWKSSVAVKISILDAIGQLGTEKDIAFIKNLENREFNFIVKSKALSAINVISPESVLPIDGIQESDDRGVGNDSMMVSPEPENEVTGNLFTSEGGESDTVATDKILDTEVPVADDNTKTLFGKENPVASNIDLLPGESKELELTPENEFTSPNESVKNTDSEEVEQLEVVFEKVAINSPDTADDFDGEADEDAINANISEGIDKTVYDFKPIDIDSEMVDEAFVEDKTASSFTMDKTQSEVEFTEAFSLADINDDKGIVCDFEEKNLDDLNHDESKISESIDEHHKTSDEMSPADYLNLKSIIEDLIVFENENEADEILQEFEEWPNLEWSMKLFNVEFVPLVKSGEDDVDAITPSKEQIDSHDFRDKQDIEGTEANALADQISDNKEDLNEVIDFGGKSTTVEDKEEAKMQLLDDIEALGDQREILLLTELLKNESSPTVKSRVKQLISSFSRLPFKAPNPLRDADNSVYGSFKPFNVFEDLFRSCDTAKKLILMDEIVAVGDEKEIEFLKSLVQDPNIRIKKKAQRTLKKLKKKLYKKRKVDDAESHGTIKNEKLEPLDYIDGSVLLEYSVLLDEMEIAPPKNPDIFDVDFELSEQMGLQKEHTIETPDNEQDSFLNQLWSLPVKILDKLNG